VPADNTTSPPIPLSPLPTVTYTDPPRPDFADPEPIYKAPLLPELAVPVLNINMPLTPDEPELDVCKTNVPLLDTVLYPLKIDKRPPVIDEDKPADNNISPPAPLLPLPTVTYTEPP